VLKVCYNLGGRESELAIIFLVAGGLDLKFQHYRTCKIS
jgi:hypothetical protein